MCDDEDLPSRRAPSDQDLVVNAPQSTERFKFKDLGILNLYLVSGVLVENCLHLGIRLRIRRYIFGIKYDLWKDEPT